MPPEQSAGVSFEIFIASMMPTTLVGVIRAPILTKRWAPGLEEEKKEPTTGPLVSISGLAGALSAAGTAGGEAAASGAGTAAGAAARECTVAPCGPRRSRMRKSPSRK